MVYLAGYIFFFCCKYSFSALASVLYEYEFKVILAVIAEILSHFSPPSINIYIK